MIVSCLLWCLSSIALVLSVLIVAHSGAYASQDSRFDGARQLSADEVSLQQTVYTASIPEYEYLTLQDLYNSTNGPGWEWDATGSTLPGIPWNFTDNSDPCNDQWQGINCTESAVGGFMHVSKIHLSEMLLFGTLPESICYFSELTQLILAVNDIYGTLPVNIGNLTRLQDLLLGTNLLAGRLPVSISQLEHLETLGVSVNFFTGPLPDISKMANLTLLDVESNYLNGTLPDSIGQHTKLDLLLINANKFSGTLPESLGNLVNVYRFIADHNQFMGTVPAALGSMVSLRRLSLQNNVLTGTIPAALGGLTNLQICYLFNNHLNGTIPPAMGEMASLQVLSLQTNKLTGPLPEMLCNCTGLTAIRMYNNQLTGPFAPCFALHPNLSVIVLYNNHFSGPLPSIWAENSQMVYLDANGNKFSGQFPDALGALPLTSIYFGSNLFTGTFPASLNNLTNLIGFYMPYNYIHGSIPADMGANMRQLQFFEINGNQMTGTIPASLKGMTVLQELHLDSNHFHGTIPTELTQLSQLLIFNLYNNHLHGTIPELIGNLSLLQYMGFDGNILTGTIPSSIGQMVYLQELEVYNNHLHGTLPNNLGNLSSLTALLLQGNRLSGTLDVAFHSGLQTALTTIQLSNNQFTGTLPDAAFRVPRLITFAAVGNCFTGSIPEAVCTSPSLEVLALSGLQSASSCQQKLLPGLSASYIITHPLTGGIPRCLFEMKSLTTLQLSGNGLTGSLPEEVQISPRLIGLTLSHNALTGSIPDNFQQRQWLNFDVSYNRLSGSLDDSLDTFRTPYYNMSNAGAALSLRNNRLSGIIPDSIKSIVNISVLDGNLFACNLEQTNLPQHDESRSNYQCGSTTFNVPYYVWMGVVLTVVVLTVLLFYGALPRQDIVTVWVQKARLWYDILVVYADVLVVQRHLPNFRYVMDLYKRVCRITILSAVYIVAILLPIYAAMSHHYGTVTHQYAYTVSGAFHSGVVPLALEMTFLLVLLACVLGGFMHCWWMRSTQRNANSTRANITNIEETGQQSSLLNRATVYCALLATNFIVVFGVNIAYVYIALYADSGLLLFAQIVLSIFKIGWNKFCGSSLMPWTASYVSPSVRDDLVSSTVEFFPLQLFLALFNNIAIPCVVVSVVSPNCFSYLLTSAPSVTSEYTVEQCLTFDNDNFVCTSFFPQVETTSFHPPFTYSFQCSSSFITYYAPAYVIMCIMSGFTIPVGQILLAQWYMHEADTLQKTGTLTWRYSVLEAILPALLKPPTNVTPAMTNVVRAPTRSSWLEGRWTVVQRNIYNPHFAANQVLLNMFTYLGLLLTFGAMFPPLAVALAVTVVVVAIYAHMKVGRFLSMAVHEKQYKFVELIDKECRGVGTQKMLQRSTFMLLANACWFYTLFLFDTLGDAVGLDGAYWVLIFMPLLPFVLGAAFVLYRMYAPTVQTPDDRPLSGPEMSSPSKDSSQSTDSDGAKANSTFSALHLDCEL